MTDPGIAIEVLLLRFLSSDVLPEEQSLLSRFPKSWHVECMQCYAAILRLRSAGAIGTRIPLESFFDVIDRPNGNNPFL